MKVVLVWAIGVSAVAGVRVLWFGEESWMAAAVLLLCFLLALTAVYCILRGMKKGKKPDILFLLGLTSLTLESGVFLMAWLGIGDGDPSMRRMFFYATLPLMMRYMNATT